MERKQPTLVPDAAKQVGEIRGRWPLTAPSVYTGRMLTTLAKGVKVGQRISLIAELEPTLSDVGCTSLLEPTPWSVNPLRGELLTGEPCAGDPHARFGGGRDREINRSFLPL